MKLTGRKTNNHHDCVKHFAQLMERRGLDCTTFEPPVLNHKQKLPDLIIERSHTLIEIKTLQPELEDVRRAETIDAQLETSDVASYEHPDYHERFMDLLDAARRQLRQYPEHNNLVAIYDLFPFWTKQSPFILMEGQQKISVRVPRDTASPSTVTSVEFHERPFRKSLNLEIGAIAFLRPNFDSMQVFVNAYSKTALRPAARLFSDGDNILVWPTSSQRLGSGVQ